MDQSWASWVSSGGWTSLNIRKWGFKLWPLWHDWHRSLQLPLRSLGGHLLPEHQAFGGFFLLCLVIERCVVCWASHETRILVISWYFLVSVIALQGEHHNLFYSRRNQVPEKSTHKSKAIQTWVTEPALKVDMCGIKGIIELPLVQLGCLLKQSLHPALLGSCAETVDIISTVTIKFAEPVSLCQALCRGHCGSSQWQGKCSHFTREEGNW